MNTRRCTMTMRIIAVFLVTIALNGCYSLSNITKRPDFSDNIAKASADSKNDRIGYISNINARFNNAPANTNDGFVKRVIGKCQESNYFKDVSYGLNAKKPDAPFYDLNLTVEEKQDLNLAANHIKAFFTGFTFFLLAPALPNTFDFSTDFLLQATRPNGTKREYKASCAGSASGTFPYSGLTAEYNKMTGELTERCLISVINQFTADK